MVLTVEAIDVYVEQAALVLVAAKLREGRGKALNA